MTRSGSSILALCALLFCSHIFIFPANAAAQEGPFKVLVTITDTQGRPIENSKVILGSNDSFWDIDLKYTDSSGNAVLYGRFGGTYELSASHGLYRRQVRTLSIKRYGDERVFNETLALERIYVRSELEKKDREVVVTVLGKDRDGSIKPLAGATVHTPDSVLTTDAKGTARYKHGYPLTTLIYFAAHAEGYVLKEDGVAVGTKPAMIYEPDPLELTLERPPLTAVPVQVMVLDEKTDLPIEKAYVTIHLRKPVVVDRKTKTMWGADYTNAKGIADFTDVTQKSISTEIVNTNELYVTVTRDKYTQSMTDLSRELLVPSKEPRVFTVWLKPDATAPTGPGWKLVSLTEDPDKRSGAGSMGTKSLTITKNKVTVAIRDSSLELTLGNVPEFIGEKEVVKIPYSLSYSGSDDNIYMSISFNTSVFDTDMVPWDHTVGKISNNRFQRNSTSGMITIKSGFAATDEASIFPQVFFGTSNVGPIIFQAKYVRVR